MPHWPLKKDFARHCTGADSILKSLQPKKVRQQMEVTARRRWQRAAFQGLLQKDQANDEVEAKPNFSAQSWVRCTERWSSCHLYLQVPSLHTQVWREVVEGSASPRILERWAAEDTSGWDTQEFTLEIHALNQAMSPQASASQVPMQGSEEGEFLISGGGNTAGMWGVTAVDVCTHHRPPALLETHSPWFNSQTEPQTDLNSIRSISYPFPYKPLLRLYVTQLSPIQNI